MTIFAKICTLSHKPLKKIIFLTNKEAPNIDANKAILKHINLPQAVFLFSGETLLSRKKKCSLRLLIVDDDENSIFLTKNYLNTLDPRLIIHSSSSAIEALEKLAAMDFDVVISDYNMPELNGLELLMELRKEQNFVPFVIFTGSGNAEIVLQGQNLGVDSYQVKTGDPEAVYKNLLKIVRKAGDLAIEENKPF